MRLTSMVNIKHRVARRSSPPVTHGCRQQVAEAEGEYGLYDLFHDFCVLKRDAMLALKVDR